MGHGCRRVGVVVLVGLALAGCDPGEPPDAPGSGPGEAIEIPLALWFDPLSLEPGDFDGDGAIDLLVGGVGVGGVVHGAVLRGNGDGSFAAPIDAHFVSCSAYPVVGRMSDDAGDDVAALGCPRTMSILTGMADATLAPWTHWPTPSPQYGIVRSSAIADFEGDGDGDLVTMHRDNVQGTNFELPGLELDVTAGAGGDGVWGVTTTPIGNTLWSGFDPQQLTVGHFDDDALLDAVLTDRATDVVRVLGTPETTFALPLELGVSVAPWSTRVADLDLDGLDDLVVSSVADTSLQVQLSAGSSGFDGLPSVDLGGFAPSDTALGDVDGDGVPDVALVDEDQAALHWLPGDGLGGFGAAISRVLGSPAIRVHARDLNGDGSDDLIAATFASGTISVLLSEP